MLGFLLWVFASHPSTVRCPDSDRGRVVVRYVAKCQTRLLHRKCGSHAARARKLSRAGLGNHHDSGETVGGIIYTDSNRSTLIQLSGSGPLVPCWDRVAWEGEVMRSEARLAYRKARTLFFRDSEFTQIDKLNAAKRLRTRIRELADCGADFTEIANTAGSEVRQDLQIERSIRNINERKRHRSASINIQNNGPQTLSFFEGPAGKSGVPAEFAARRR